MECLAERSWSLPSAALANALLGNAAAAEQSIAKAPGPATSKLAGAVLLARAGNFAEAERQLNANEVILDQLGGVLRAFAETLSAYVASKPADAAVSSIQCRCSGVERRCAEARVARAHAFVVRASQGPVAGG